MALAAIAVVATVCALLEMTATATAATPSRSGFYVRGGGFGPGIGMSAYGDAGYAEHGWGYRQILAHYYQGTAIGTVGPNRIVKVLLAQGAASFSGATRIAGSRRALNASTTYSVLASGSRLRIVTGRRTVGTFSAPLSVSGRGPVSLLGVGRYDGSLVFRVVDGQVQTVNAVGVDDYVRGVLAPEMPPDWPIPALEALAVAARSVGVMTDAGGVDYDVYDDTRTQNYRGVGAETARTNEAVALTSGQVVTYHGAVVEVFYFASSGGYTESIQNVWPGAVAEPWLRGVPDPYDNSFGNPYHSWSENMTLARAAGLLAPYYRGVLRGVRILRTGVSPRVISARVVGSRGSSTVSGTTLEDVFGTLSTSMTFTTITDQGHDAGSSVSGSVYPVIAGRLVYVQQFRGGRWVRAGWKYPSRSGSFTISVRGRGRYRAVYGGVDGPAVNAG